MWSDIVLIVVGVILWPLLCAVADKVRGKR
jgi:hypothetical protein